MTARQAVQDQWLREQAAFDRQVAQERMLHQAEALRLASERLQLTASLQAARLGMNRQARPHWVLRGAGFVVVNGLKAVHYVFHRVLP